MDFRPVIEPRGSGLIDAHLHCWDPARLPMAWLAEVPELERPCGISEYLSDLGGRADDLEAAVLVESAVDDSAVGRELDWLIEQVADAGPVRAAVAGWRPMAEFGELRKQLDAISEAPGVVGVREVMHSSAWTAEDLRDPRLSRALRDAGGRGLLVELCVRPDQLISVADLLATAPETTVILDHLGRPRTGAAADPAWMDALGRVADAPNVLTKMSALIECAQGDPWSASGFRPFIDAAINRFGSDRVLWGGNWPRCRIGGSMASWLEACEEILRSVPGPDREAIFAGNARRIYGLSTGPTSV